MYLLYFFPRRIGIMFTICMGYRKNFSKSVKKFNNHNCTELGYITDLKKCK